MTKDPDEMYEARRWCSGDEDWSRWQPCTYEQMLRYSVDDSFQVRMIKPHAQRSDESPAPYSRQRACS